MKTKGNTTRSARKLRSDTAILITLGVFLFLGGVALVVAPEYSVKAKKGADLLLRYTGVQSGMLMLGGLVFFSLGVFSRRITHLVALAPKKAKAAEAEDGESQSDVTPLLEQLAEDVAKVRASMSIAVGGIGKTSDVVERTSDAVEQLLAAQSAGEVAQEEDPAQAMKKDPLFVLASSLDSMNARLDERMSALMERVDERLAELRVATKPASVGHGDSSSVDDEGDTAQLTFTAADEVALEQDELFLEVAERADHASDQVEDEVEHDGGVHSLESMTNEALEHVESLVQLEDDPDEVQLPASSDDIEVLDTRSERAEEPRAPFARTDEGAIELDVRMPDRGTHES